MFWIEISQQLFWLKSRSFLFQEDRFLCKQFLSVYAVDGSSDSKQPAAEHGPVQCEMLYSVNQVSKCLAL